MWRSATVVAKDEFIQIDGELGLLTPWYVPVSHCCKFPMARPASGTTDVAPRCNADRSGWIRGMCVTPTARRQILPASLFSRELALKLAQVRRKGQTRHLGTLHLERFS